jgi:predicted enzyme related to lactoylglutathione lyase
VEVDVLFAGVAVCDLAAAAPFYERLLGRPPDVVVHEGEVMWQVAAAGWLYVVTDPARAGRALVSLAVGDLDAAVAGASARGVDPSATETVAGAGRKASYTDPDGNRVALIEVEEPAH